MFASGSGKNQIFSLQPLDGRSTFNYKNGLSNLKSKPAVRSVFLALLKIEISAFYTELSAISPQMKIWQKSRFWKGCLQCKQSFQKYRFFTALNSVPNFFKSVRFRLSWVKVEIQKKKPLETKNNPTSHPTKHFVGSTFQMRYPGLLIGVRVWVTGMGVRIRVTGIW